MIARKATSWVALIDYAITVHVIHAIDGETSDHQDTEASLWEWK